MTFVSVNLTNFRNFSAVTLQPVTHGFNLIHGANGSGKTSFLEAIYYLSLGRSFRTLTTQHIIQHHAESFSLFGHILAAETEQKIAIGLERRLQGSLKIRIAGRDAESVAELTSLTPVQLINPDCYSLLEGGPIFRRKFLDWGSFYLNADFLRVWRRYERALKQRNAALKGQIPRKELQIWSAELIQVGELLHHCRIEYVKRLKPYLEDAVKELLTRYQLQISYKQGWQEDISYQQALTESCERDMAAGFTSVGPHRADLEITVDQTAAKDILSRGQQKLFVCAMIVAQGALLHDCSQKRPVYLVDDLPSELDSISRDSLVNLLAKQAAQVFVTAIEPKALKHVFDAGPVKMFHVKHNGITEMSPSFTVAYAV